MKVTAWIAILFFLSGACVAAKNLPAKYQGPVAQRPTYTTGEYWVYENSSGAKVKWTFVGTENNLLVFQSDKRKDLLYTTPDLFRVKRINGKTGKVLFERSPESEDRWLIFPLWVGKTWEGSIEVLSQNLGIPVTIDFIYRVTNYRKIEVKAGILEAFEIERRWNARGFSDSGSNTLWYAPAAKQVIKHNFDNQIELVEYNVQVQDVRE